MGVLRSDRPEDDQEERAFMSRAAAVTPPGPPLPNRSSILGALALNQAAAKR